MTKYFSELDLIIIGAGIYGIQAARTYLAIHPTRQVVVLEASNSIGGVWSFDRVYNDFWTQTPLGLLEFSDQPIQSIPKEDQYFGFFKAKHVASYLGSYCVSRIYNGESLASRIRTNEPVTNVRKDNGIWHVSTESGSIFSASKVIDASGLTSIPNFPRLPKREAFQGTIIHHKDFAKWECNLKKGSKMKILVIGGAKSAADVAYACAKTGQDVTWLIRRSGSGPAAFVSAKGKMGYANSNESFYTRLTSLFLVSLFALSMGYTKLLSYINCTNAGQRILQRIWQDINARAHQEANYDRADGRANGFGNLKPDTELFWQNDSTGINQRADFFDVIARHVKVVREDLSSLCEEGIVLKSGEMVRANVIICATGWKMEHPYYDDELASTLGLPVSTKVLLADQVAHWDELAKHADKEITSTFPILDSPWAHANDKRASSTASEYTTMPFRLYKSVVPIHDSSILFLGRLMLGNHFRAAEVQALFACGVLDGKVELPATDVIEADVARTIAWCKRRYLKKGELGNWFYWDMVPYTDTLLQEMGLNSHRRGSWWRDLVRPCYAKDLKGLIKEYKKKHGFNDG